jgi:hypothetical protein
MIVVMRNFLVLASLVLAACSAESDAFVEELSTSSQINLCENFLDDFCSTPAGVEFCEDPCINTGCGPAVENNDVDIQCDGIFESEVEDCGITGDFAVCAEGGGCMIDALEAACS